MADTKPNVSDWLDAPADTPFPDLSNDQQIGDWLDDKPAQPTQPDVETWLDTPEDTWAQLGQKVIENTPAMFKQSYAGVMQQAAESPVPAVPGREQQHAIALELMGKSPQQVQEKSEAYGKMFADAAADMQENAPNVDPESLKGYAYDASTSLIQMLPGLAASIITRKPMVGATSMGAQVSGQKYGESRAAGRTPEEAQQDAAVFGLAEGIPEMLPLGVVMKEGGKFLWRTLKTAGAEGLSEMFTQAIQDGYDKGILNEDMTWGDVWRNMQRAGLLGTMVGAGVAVAEAPFHRSDSEDKKGTGSGAPPATPPASGSAPPNAAAASGAPSAEAGGMPSSPPAAAATTPSPAAAPVENLNIGTRVGLKSEGAAPQGATIEGVQDGYVYWRDDDGNQQTDKVADFKRDLTAPPPHKNPDRITGEPPAAGDNIPPPSESDINDFDPFAQKPREPKPVAPSPQQSMPLADTKRIQALRDAASANMVLAAEGARNGQRTPEWVASMRVEAAKLMDEAAALEAKLTPSRTAPDATAATPEQMAARRMGRLGTAAPATSEAVTGPQQFEVTPPKAPAPPVQPALAPVENNEAENPPPPIERPTAPKKTWQERLREQIGNRQASLNDPVAMARNLGTTPEAITAELQGIATGKNAPIEIIRGTVKKDKKGNPVQSPRAGKWRYTPRPTGKAVESLSDFVYGSGGMAAGSFAGELQARDLHTARRPFKGNLIKPGARMDVQAMADHAMQAGYPIPTEEGNIYVADQRHQGGVGSSSANVDAFLDMLSQDQFGSRRTYRIGEEPQTEPGPRPMTLTERKREATRRLTALGLEPKGKTVEELEQELDAVLDAVGDATPLDTMDFAAAEIAAVDAMDPEAQEALRQEAKDDYPHEYDEAWFAAEVAEGVSPAQPAADSGVQEGDRAPGPVADRQGATASRTEGAAETASEGVQDDEPVWLGSPTGDGKRVGSPQFSDTTPRWRADTKGLSLRKIAERIAEFMRGPANQSRQEHGVFISADGKILWAGSAGLRSNLPFTDAVVDALKNGVSPINLHHNHPNKGGPLSKEDVRILAYPNSNWVIAYDVNGNYTAARLSDRFRSVLSAYTIKQRTELINWAVSNSIAATMVQHRPIFEAGRMTPAQFELNDSAWRALHEAGLIDYQSDYTVPDYTYPIIDKIRDQITERLKQHGIDVATPNRIHRPAESIGTSRGLDEISGGPQGGEAADAIRGPADSRGAQGSLFEEQGRIADAGSGSISEPVQAETGGVLARLMSDESGAVPLDFWTKIKDALGLGKKGTTAEDIAGEGVRMNLGTPGSLRSMSRMARYLRMAVSLASIDRPSSVYWNAILRRDHTRAGLERQGVDQVKDYLGLEPAARARIDKVLEHDRLYGIDRKKTGRDVVVKIPDKKTPFGVGRPELSKPGEIVALDAAETAALHNLRAFFDGRLNLMGEAVARERGYKGAFDRKSIEKAIAEADHPRTRKQAEAALEILDRTEEMRRAGYVPFQRYGDTYITIKPKANAENETAWFEMMDTGSVFDNVFSRDGGKMTKPLAARLAELQKRFPKDQFDYTVGSVTPQAIADLNLPAIERAFAALNAKQGPGTAKIIDDLLHQVYEARKAALGKQSNNVPGYSTDFERAITDYVRQTSAIVARMSHRQDVDSAYDATQAHPVKRVREYWEKHNLHQEKEGDDYAGLRKLGFFMFLWANPASAIINLTQTPLVTQMQLGAWAGPRAPLLAHGGMLEGLGAIRANKNGLYVDVDSLGKTDAEKDMLRELQQEGRFDAAIAEDLGGGAFGLGKNRNMRPHLQKLSYAYELGASGFNTTETVNRVAAALAYFRAAQNPQLRERMRDVYKQDQNFIEMVQRRGMQPIDIARFGVDETQFIGGKINRAPAMRGIGAVLLQFKTYIANYLRLMHKNFTRMGPRGKIAGTIMLSALLAISGMFGIPFGDDALKAADFLVEQATGIDPMIEYRTREFLADAGFGEYGAEVLTRGLGRNVFGADIGGRIGMGNIFPDDSITSLAPVVTGTLGRLAEANDRAHTGQPLGAGAAIAGAFGGSGAQNLLKGTVVYPNEGVSTRRGNYTVRPGDITLKDIVIKSLGFQPTKATRAGEKQYQEGRLANATQEARTAMLTRIARLVVAGMDARAAGDPAKAADYNRQIEALYAKNAAQLIDPDLPDWQKVAPAKRQAVRQRVLSLIKPEIANMRRAAKISRPSLQETPFVEP